MHRSSTISIHPFHLLSQALLCLVLLHSLHLLKRGLNTLGCLDHYTYRGLRLWNSQNFTVPTTSKHKVCVDDGDCETIRTMKQSRLSWLLCIYSSGCVYSGGETGHDETLTFKLYLTLNKVKVNHPPLNSLRPSDAIWRHRSGSMLARVMACCPSTPSHYLNQCWLIISRVSWHSCEGNFIRGTSATIH